MQFNDRIAAIMRHYHLGAKELAELCGVQRTAITHILNGRNRPSVGFLSKLSEAFPELDTRWLLHGTGTMFTNVTKGQPEQVSIDHSNSIIETPESQKAEERVVTDVTNLDLNSDKERNLSSETPHSPLVKRSSTRVVKVILIYEDGTFTTHAPAQE